MKVLLVVLVLGAFVFAVGKPVALLFSSESDFVRRRNVWIALTITGLLSPNIWMYAVVAVPLFIWAGRKDSNPLALYLLLLHVVPPVAVEIPAPGIELFEMDNYRLLAFCVLVPAAIRLRRSTDGIRAMSTMNLLLLGYGAVIIALFVPPDAHNHVVLPDSITSVLRRAFLFFLDAYLLYFVVRRVCRSRHDIEEAMAAFCLSGAIMAVTAIFEYSRHWLLFGDLIADWSNNPLGTYYLMRGNHLRAQATAGHALTLGYLLAIAIGFWMHLKVHIRRSKPVDADARSPIVRLRPLAYPLVMAATVWLPIKSFVQNRNHLLVIAFCLGLLATYSRGPWLGALIIYLAFALLKRGGFSGLFRAAAILAVLGGLLAVSPMGKQITDALPFFGGTVDQESLDYRERLLRRTWDLIQASPYFGDQDAWSKLGDMRQGEGIIDLVNTYAEIALLYGLCGLSLLLGFFLVGLLKTYLFIGVNRLREPELSSLGASLAACMLGTLVMMASNSFGLGLEKMYYVLAGFGAAYSALGSHKA